MYQKRLFKKVVSRSLKQYSRFDTPTYHCVIPKSHERLKNGKEIDMLQTATFLQDYLHIERMCKPEIDFEVDTIVLHGCFDIFGDDDNPDYVIKIKKVNYMPVITATLSNSPDQEFSIQIVENEHYSQEDILKIFIDGLFKEFNSNE